MGRKEEAFDVLVLLHGDKAASSEFLQIEAALQLEEGRFFELFTIFSRPLLIGVLLAASQQVSGITPIFSFLPDIFRTASAATGDAFFQSVLVGLTNLFFHSCGSLACGFGRPQITPPGRHLRTVDCSGTRRMDISHTRQRPDNRNLDHGFLLRVTPLEME